MKPFYFRFIGWLLIVIGTMMTAPLIVSFYYRDYNAPTTKYEITAFIVSIFLTVAAGIISLLMSRGEMARMITVKDGFLMAAIGWILVGLFSSLPYFLTGAIPGYIDPLFESMSGITTTGASVLSDMDTLPRGVMFWRCMTQWIGGMGIIGLFVAILPAMGEGSHNLFRAEIPGGANFEKLTPRIRATARALWSMYIAFTVLEVILLVFAGMPLYDSICHAFTSISTAGFSTYSQSIGAVDSLAVRWIFIVFMLIGGISFTLHYRLIMGGGFVHWKNEEFRLFIRIFFAAVVFMTIDLFLTGHTGSSIVDTVTDSVFQVTSILTTTGYSSADFGGWSPFAQSLLVILMLVGGCSGSTSGSVKVIRHLIAAKAISAEFKVMANPREVVVAKLHGKPLPEEVLRNTLVFIALFIVLLVTGGLVLTFLGSDMKTAFSASLACLANIGPGLGDVGPAVNYGSLPAGSKLILIIEMLMGRLELFGFLIFFMTAVRRQVKIT